MGNTKHHNVASVSGRRRLEHRADTTAKVVAIKDFQLQAEHGPDHANIPNPFAGKISDEIWYDSFSDRLSVHLDALSTQNPWELLRELALECERLRSQLYHPAATPMSLPSLWDAYKLYNQIAAYYTLNDPMVRSDHTEVHEYLGLPVGCLLATLRQLKTIEGINLIELKNISEDIEYEILSVYENALIYSDSSTLSSDQWAESFRLNHQTEDIVYEQLQRIKQLIPHYRALQYNALALKIQECASEVVETATHFGTLLLKMNTQEPNAVIYNWADYYSRAVKTRSTVSGDE